MAKPVHSIVSASDRRLGRRRGRRDFLRQATARPGVRGAALDDPGSRPLPNRRSCWPAKRLIDITPPLGIELAGFHRPPDKPRLGNSVRQPATARALVLGHADARAAIVALDMLGVSADFTRRVQAAVAEKTGIPGDNVHFVATHTHSMPTLKPLRQWGRVRRNTWPRSRPTRCGAVQAAKDDLAPASLHLGKARAEGGSFNRTTETWKTEDQFDAASTDGDRWLDTVLTALVFRRTAGKHDLLWYHYSAHPVCFTDERLARIGRVSWPR